MINPLNDWRNKKYLPSYIGQVGKIISWTVVHTAPKNFSDQEPYPVVIVKLANGLTIMTQLVDYLPEHLCYHQKVICVLRKLYCPEKDSIVPYGIKAKPV